MKTILTSALLLAGIASFAQTATKPAATTQTAPLSAKAKELCKEWVLVKTENFGDEHMPTDKQKTDKLILLQDGHYRLVMEGVTESGTWSLDKSNIWITLTTDGGAVKKFKIIESSATALKVDYRDADDIHNILFYALTPAPGKK
jgi:hypothetical protein